MTGKLKPSTRAVKLFDLFYRSKFKLGITGYTQSQPLREVCASGGLVTSLLSRRIGSGATDGAFVAGLGYNENGCLSPLTQLARSESDLLAYAGSVYSDFDHVEQIIQLLQKTDGVFDIVALPCQLSRLRAVFRERKDLESRTGLLIGLWCGHATGVRLMSSFLSKWRISGEDIAEFRYRRGQWRGRTRITLKDGSRKEKSFARGYGLYQNMYADCAVRCFSCGDHFGDSADISFGDCWISSERKEEHKKTMAVSLTDSGSEAIVTLLDSPSVRVSRIDPVWAVESQKRAVIWHTYSRAARARMKNLFGISIGCSSDVTPRWNDYLSGFLTLFYYSLFNSRLRGVMFRLPWWILFPPMAFQKLMLNR